MRFKLDAFKVADAKPFGGNSGHEGEGVAVCGEIKPAANAAKGLALCLGKDCIGKVGAGCGVVKADCDLGFHGLVSLAMTYR